MDTLRAVPCALAALLLSACAPLPPAASAPFPAGARYVAMGSSFASGPGLGPLEPGSPERCARSLRNYANLLAARLDLALDDQSCSGATTANVLSAWQELPAQLDAVTPATRLVTVTVGGNDLDYMGLLFSAACKPETGLTFADNHYPCPARVHLPSEEKYAQTRANLIRIAQIVHSRAPQAKVVFVQYVTLVPPGTLCAAEPIDATAQREARELAARLARITREAAQETGSLVLPVEQLSAAHTACDAHPWSNGMPKGGSGSTSVPWHPNAAGHAAFAAALVMLLTGQQPG